jgi:hypothetical protein
VAALLMWCGLLVVLCGVLQQSAAAETMQQV